MVVFLGAPENANLREEFFLKTTIFYDLHLGELVNFSREQDKSRFLEHDIDTR